MRLTQQQIKDLTNTELNRAMVWCYLDQPALTFRGAATYKYGGIKDSLGAHIIIPDVSRFDELVDVDFLGDWNLLMPLVIDSELEYLRNSWGEFEVEVPDGAVYSTNKSLQRAYCEALVFLKVGV